MSIAISVENVSKVYKLGEIGTGTLGQDLTRWYKMRILRKEDPYLKLGHENNRRALKENDVVYSLKDINFDLSAGDSLGVMGKNGAGKSTLLKIISRITKPTTGSVKIRGKVTSLLEVGTGFHPDLTGRENIYLNGAILGMRKKEIDQKLDQIIDFSEIGSYIDTPVRRYSSGMYVRLAFSVSAHLESDILILDEVLSVGDADFQVKCRNKIDEVRKQSGKTILFVSHSLSAVKAMCRNSLLLENGLVKEFGPTINVASTYMGSNDTKENPKLINEDYEGFIVKSFAVRNVNCDYNSPVERDKSVCLEVFYDNQLGHQDVVITIQVKDGHDRVIFTSNSISRMSIILKGEGKIAMKAPPYFFNQGSFSINLLVSTYKKGVMNLIGINNDIYQMKILQEAVEFSSWYGENLGYLNLDMVWIDC